jgi:uncharacterized membrane protein YoaK (UPF0700 family)
MPLDYLRGFTAAERTDATNRRLGRSLAFVAGAANAGGFLAVGQYTSHMSGIVSSLADNLALGEADLLVAGFSSLLSFLAGAATSAILINWGRRRRRRSLYAMPLMLEAMLMLCFVMGLRNAIITKISRAEIRTTHVTGLVTDIGIELGKLFYWNGIGAWIGR